MREDLVLIVVLLVLVVVSMLASGPYLMTGIEVLHDSLRWSLGMAKP